MESIKFVYSIDYVRIIDTALFIHYRVHVSIYLTVHVFEARVVWYSSFSMCYTVE